MSVPPPRPQSPLTSAGAGTHPPTAVAAHLGPPADPIDVDLVVRSIPHDALLVDKPFRVACTLGVAAFVREGRQRTLSFAVQHVQPPSAAASVSAPVPAASASATTAASHIPQPAGANNTRPSSPAPRTPLALLDSPIVDSPRTTQLAGVEADESPLRLPPPEPVAGDEVRYEKLRGATHFLGPSMLLVPPMAFARTILETTSGENDARIGGAEPATKKEERFWEFELAYTPLKIGFVPVGGLRVLLLEDRVDGGVEAYLDKRANGPVTLKEWDVIGEIWVKP